MTNRRRKRHSPEQIVKKLRDADAMLNAGQDLAAVLQALEVSEQTSCRCRPRCAGLCRSDGTRLSTGRPSRSPPRGQPLGCLTDDVRQSISYPKAGLCRLRRWGTLRVVRIR